MPRDIESHNSRITIAADDKENGASHVYLLQYTTDTGNLAAQVLSFQRGPVGAAGINGITHELLLLVLIDRLESFQAGKHACTYNAEALLYIKSALEALNARTTEREKRGVEGDAQEPFVRGAPKPFPVRPEQSCNHCSKPTCDRCSAYRDGQWAGAVERDRVYAERNKLVCALSKLWPSHLAQHPASDTSWDPNWRNIVCIHSPVGQLCWHIMDSELPMFEHLKLKANDWDGHTTEAKYERLASLVYLSL